MVTIKNIKRILLLVIISVGLYACDSYPDGVPQVENVTMKLSNVYPRVGEAVQAQLAGNLSDFVSVAWNFGDGTTANEASSIKTYSKDGIYSVSVTYKTKSSNEEITKKMLVKVSGLALSESIKNLDANKSKVWVMAHRGNTEDKKIPENSIKALEAAIAAGVDVMEIDTHITKDGIVMVCHDESIDRTTTGSGKIPNMTFEEIRKFNLLDRNGGTTSEVMPTLQEMLEAGRGRMYFNLDYSPRTASTEQVFSVVKECGMIEGVFFYTGSESNYVKSLLSYDNACHPYTWGGNATNYENLVGKDRKFFVQLGYEQANSSQASVAKSNGMLVSVNILDTSVEASLQSGNFSTIDDLIAAEVRMIQTDVAGTLIKYLKETGHR